MLEWRIPSHVLVRWDLPRHEPKRDRSSKSLHIGKASTRKCDETREPVVGASALVVVPDLRSIIASFCAEAVADDEHRTGRVPHHMLADRTQKQPPEAGTAMRAHDHDVNAKSVGDPADDIGGITDLHHLVHVDVG